MAPGACSSASITPSMIADVTNGRTASWISTRSGACAASASRPLRTEACRVGAPFDGAEQPLAFQAGDSGQIERAHRRPRSRPGPRRCGGAPGTRASVRASTGTPPIRAYCFGSEEAARVPRPAATISAAMFKSAGPFGMAVVRLWLSRRNSLPATRIDLRISRAFALAKPCGHEILCPRQVQQEKMPNKWAIAQVLPRGKGKAAKSALGLTRSRAMCCSRRCRA